MAPLLFFFRRLTDHSNELEAANADKHASETHSLGQGFEGSNTDETANVHDWADQLHDPTSIRVKKDVPEFMIALRLVSRTILPAELR